MMHTSNIRELSSLSRTQFCPAYTVTFKATLSLAVNIYPISKFIFRNGASPAKLISFDYYFKAAVKKLNKNAARRVVSLHSFSGVT